MHRRPGDPVELTAEQADVLGVLERDREALVTGWAGAGKSVLAAHWARELAARGEAVLLVGVSEPAAHQLQARLAGPANLTVGTVHQVGHRIVAGAGLAPASPDRALLDALPTQLPRAARALGIGFDAVVVDEGHELNTFWWAALRALLRDPAASRFHVFADAYPDAYADWDAPFAATPLELGPNRRSTAPVVARVAALCRAEIRPGAAAGAAGGAGGGGPEPDFVVIDRGEDPTRAIARQLRDLLASGRVAPEGIAVLTTERQLVEGLQGKRVDGHRLVQAGAAGITVDLIQRFKGLECEAAIVVLGEVATRGARALAYVGLSRPRRLLTVYGTAPVRKALGWPLPTV